MSAAQQSYTTQIFLLRAGKEQGYVSAKVSEIKKGKMARNRVNTTSSSLIVRNKQKKEAQIGRKKTRHKERGLKKVVSLVGFRQPTRKTNIILHFMIISTLLTRPSPLLGSRLDKSFIGSGKNINESDNKSGQVISLRSKSSLASPFGLLPDEWKKENCCRSGKFIEGNNLKLAHFSIRGSNSKGVDEKIIVNEKKRKLFKRDEGDEKSDIEFRRKTNQKKMHKRASFSGLLTKAWLNQVFSPRIKIEQEKVALKVKERDEILHDRGRTKRSLAIQGRLTSWPESRQVAITEKGGTSSFTSTSSTSESTSTSNSASLTNEDTQVSIKPAVSNNINQNKSSSSPDFNSNKNASNNNNTQVTLSKQQQIQEQAFQRRLMELKQKYMTNRAISDRAYYILLVIYSLFIIVGTISNSLICLTVILKPKILSPRNIFIVNLAGSDLLLCVFTMPFSFIEISMKMWQMGLIPCKLVAGLQATSIFVSTISITAIALDRYKVIVYPTHQESANGTRSAALLLASVWIGALLLSLPLFRFRTVEHLDLPHKYDTIKSIDFCVEAWPFPHGRGIYSVISMMFQYVLPITIVSVVYAKISDKLQKRLIRRQRLTQLECRQKRQLNLIRRTHTMLISVSLIFGLSWLPLNLLNVIGDFSDLFRGDDQLFRVVFAVCHLIGCSSACSNPILYGYLNENFRKEFHQVYTYHMHRLARLCRRLTGRLKNQDEEEEYDDEEDEDEEEVEDEDEEEEEEDDDDDDEDDDDYDEQDEEYSGDREFYIEDSGSHPPVTPTSTIDSSAFASDDLEKKENQFPKQYKNRDNIETSSEYHSPIQLPPRLNSSPSGDHTPIGRHLPLNSTASENVSRKCSLPLPNVQRARGSRNSSASMESNQMNCDQNNSPGPKSAQSCILELAESCVNANKAGKFFSTNRSQQRKNNDFKTPELKLFPPSSATATSQTTSSGLTNFRDSTSKIDIESSAVRRYSFQTLSNSRQTLGKTMRFCLCVSGDSLVESDAAYCNSSSQVGNSRSLSKSPRRKVGQRRRVQVKGSRANNRDGVTNKSKLVGSEQMEASSLGPLPSPLALQSSNKRNLRRRRRLVSPANCDCNCHKSVQIESPAPNTAQAAVNINQDRRRSSNLLEPPTQQQQQSECREKRKRPSKGDISHSNNDIGSKARQGRRVWLRFFPGKQQERYIDCATSNTTAEQRNGDKSAPIKSQQLDGGITSDGIGGHQEQSVKIKGENGEEEEEEEEDDKRKLYSEDNNAVREQTKALNAQAGAGAGVDIISGSKEKSKQQLEDQARGLKQHCANCKQEAAKMDEKKRRTRPRRRRKEGPSASGSRKSRLRENLERKVKGSGANNRISSARNNETMCGAENAKTFHSNQTDAISASGGGKKDFYRLAGEGNGAIEGLKLEVGDSMTGGSKIAGCYYLSVETARSRGGSDVSKEQSTELVVINGDIDVFELEIRAKDTAASSYSCRNSPSLFTDSSFEKDNKQRDRGMLEQQNPTTKSSIDIRNSTMQDKINNMQSSALCSGNSNSNSGGNNKSNNMDKSNFSSGNCNGRLGMQITTTAARTGDGSSIALGQQENTRKCVAGSNANVANNRRNVAKVSCKHGSLAGCQMNYTSRVKKKAEQEKEASFSGNCLKTDIGREHDSVAQAIKSTSLNAVKSSNSAKSDNSRAASETPALVGATFSLSVLPDTLMTDRLDARSDQLRASSGHHIDETDADSNSNINNKRGDDVRVDNNGDENLSSRELVERKSDARTNSHQQLVRMPNSLTHPSTNCPASSLQSDSNSSSCACLHSQSSSCTCSISSTCRREAANFQTEEAITSGCTGAGEGCERTTESITTKATCVSVIKNATNSQLASINQDRTERPQTFAQTKTTSTNISGILEPSKWRSNCANSTLSSTQDHHEAREEKGSNKPQMVSSSLNALPSATTSIVQSLSIRNAKTNASMNICQPLSASTSCSGSPSGSVSLGSHSNSTSTVESVSTTTTTTTTNNSISISRSSLASNDEFTCSSSVAGAAVAQTPLDSFASSSASLEVARVMASAPTFNIAQARCPASSRMAKQTGRRLSITSFGTSTDLLKLKTNERDSNISLQPLVGQCNGRSSASSHLELSSSAKNRNGHANNVATDTISKEQTTSSGQRANINSLAGKNNSTMSDSIDSALWQRFGGNEALTKSQEDMIIAERERRI